VCAWLAGYRMSEDGLLAGFCTALALTDRECTKDTGEGRGSRD
jgi:hypothetical protein